MDRRAAEFLIAGVVTVASVFFLSGCAGTPSVEDRRFEQFGQAGRVQTALIVGDLEAARRPAAWLAEHDGLAELGSEAQPWAERIRTASSEVEQATSIGEAADATGRIADACAGCHTAADQGPRFRSSGPADDASEGAHMVQHLWAMDRMWIGLVAPDDAMWRSGAAAIADREPSDAFPGGTATAALAEAVHAQAARARDVSVDERGAAYAEMIKGCASCHAVVGAGDHTVR